MPAAKVIEIRSPSGKSFENAIRAGLAKARERDSARIQSMSINGQRMRQRAPGDQRVPHERALSGV